MNSLRNFIPGRGALAATLLAGTLAGVLPAHAAAPAGQDPVQLQKQLDDARARLDDAARDVAELSQQLYGEAPGGRPMPPPGAARGAMLGVNIGGAAERADGVEIVGVSPSGPAATAGLRKGDVITAVDGKVLRKAGERSAGRQLVEHLRGVTPGQVVKVDYLRDGRKLSASVTTVAAEPPMFRALRERLPLLEGMQLPQEFEEFVNPGGRGFRSLELVPLTPKLGQYFGTDKGLLVVKAPAAALAGLEEGDVIQTIGGRVPDSPRHAFRILGSYQPGEQVKVEVLRQRKRLALELRLPDVEPPAPGFHPAPPPPAPAPAAAARGISS
jgi:S1-C subfamily serine protease